MYPPMADQDRQSDWTATKMASYSPLNSARRHTARLDIDTTDKRRYAHLVTEISKSMELEGSSCVERRIHWASARESVQFPDGFSQPIWVFLPEGVERVSDHATSSIAAS